MNKDDLRLLTHNEFYDELIKDLKQARALVVIQSPYLTARRVGQIRRELHDCTQRGVRVCVIARAPDEKDASRDAILEAMEVPIRLLKEVGVHVSIRADAHEKLATIDDHILWLGSLNALSYYRTNECMMRLVSRDFVAEAIPKYSLDFCTPCSKRLALSLIPTDESYGQWLQLIGKYIVRRRGELNLTQPELAKASKLDRSLISRIELGKRSMRADKLHRIFRVLRVELLPIPWHFTRRIGELLNYRFASSANVENAAEQTLTEESVQIVGETYLEWLQLIGNCVVRRRGELNVSQSELVRESELDQSLVSKIELGRRNIQADTLHRILRVLRLRLLPVPWHFVPQIGEQLDFSPALAFKTEIAFSQQTISNGQYFEPTLTDNPHPTSTPNATFVV